MSAAGRSASSDDALEASLATGARRIVLDNTYLSRVDAEPCGRDRRPAWCRGAVHLDRHAARAGSGQSRRAPARPVRLPSRSRASCGGGTRRARAPAAPTRQMRAFREFEPRRPDEGFVEVERVLFERYAANAGEREGRATEPSSSPLRRCKSAGLGTRARVRRSRRPAPCLRLETGREHGRDPRRRRCMAGRAVNGPVMRALCPHPGGPPVCWCRPPLPGLILAFARTY